MSEEKVEHDMYLCEIEIMDKETFEVLKEKTIFVATDFSHAMNKAKAWFKGFKILNVKITVLGDTCDFDDLLEIVRNV